ncbi:MAG: DUF3343 domain-containing protein [Acidobacteria bacterium]|nr:DUF3343 domain-containing protein [Acidobacteriota bacterium]
MKFIKRKNKDFEGEGLILFREVSDAMKAERVLKKAGYRVQLVAPPPELRKGCDLAVAVKLVEKLGIERTLQRNTTGFVEMVPLNFDSPEILNIVKVTDFGEWVMVKAANMKLTFEKRSGIIVNVSGGGCPDIPYMHASMIDKKLQEAPHPDDLGYTLCALMLERAMEEGLALYEKGGAAC